MKKEVEKLYGQKIRVRACGICFEQDKLLLVNHSGITPGNFWAPPGGGIEFGQTAEEALKKEFAEETGLTITCGKFLFGCEFLQHPLHAIEVFFEVATHSGILKKGNDPELQIIQDVRFMSTEEIGNIPRNELHGIFRFIKSPADLRALNGFFRI